MASNIMDQFRRGLDRASFEADRLMRYNRVRAEASRIRQQAREQTHALGEKVLELYQANDLPVPALRDLARAVMELNERVDRKEDEAALIQKEEWVDPEGEEPAGDPQPGAATAPPPRVAATGDPQIGAATGPAPTPGAAAAPAPTGAAVERHVCPACGTALRPQAAFCPHCGMKQR
jgi:hypothetical protein